MNNEIYIIISSIVTAFIGWFFGRKRQQADTDNVVLKNLELSIGLYREVINDLKKEIESLNLKVQDLESKIDELHKENIRLKSSI
jgi:peptidoglycan hydrolase CwlO-like protein